MGEMNKFEKSLRIGEIGERSYLKYAKENNDIATIFDVRADKRFQDIDVDFLEKRLDGTINFVEVKADEMADKTGNIFYELLTSGNKGCLTKTMADYIYYYIIRLNKAYRIDIRQLQTHIYDTPYPQTSGGDDSFGLLIPIDKLVQLRIAIAI